MTVSYGDRNLPRATYYSMWNAYPEAWGRGRDSILGLEEMEYGIGNRGGGGGGGGGGKPPTKATKFKELIRYDCHKYLIVNSLALL